MNLLDVQWKVDVLVKVLSGYRGKEKVSIQPENQTLASVTFQNYFRMYPKLAGMTGTALTEEGEFSEIYNLEVLEVPTNLQVAG